MTSRRGQVDAFYKVLALLAVRVGGARRLGDCSGRDGWPARGVYFVFEPGETRRDGRTPRVVRVGTQALKHGSNSTLWGRLRQHRGTAPGGAGGGNHRGSVFRLHVGEALIASSAVQAPPGSWGHGGSARPEVRAAARSLETLVSRTIGDMSVSWLTVPDEPGPSSRRGVLERGAIALLSNYRRTPVDPPSPTWLGRHARAPEIRSSGLWNVNHVAERYDDGFVDQLTEAVEAAPAAEAPLVAGGRARPVVEDPGARSLSAIGESRDGPVASVRPTQPLLFLLMLACRHLGWSLETHLRRAPGSCASPPAGTA